MLAFIKRIFIGKNRKKQQMENAYYEQKEYVIKVWRDNTYGIERLIRLFLCIIQFIYPTLFIRNIFGRGGETARKLAIEGYMVVKLIFPLLIVFGGFWRYPVFVILVVYFLSETIFHILGLIFLSDLHAVPLSYRRSILLLLMNYLEVVFDFSVLYKVFALFNRSVSEITALYFSFVVNTTLGFGDYYPVNTTGRVLVIVQLAIFIMFVVVFINYFSSRTGEIEIYHKK